ncbi:hypothetical protein B0H13DRAFT_1897049 [Mycena leptocephala]|nr:hypothetical protein B0H13DRAFT_1897049 [Mycena leptocephala]
MPTDASTLSAPAQRNPSKTVQPVRRRQPQSQATKASRELANQQRRDQAERLENDLQDYFDTQAKFITDLCDRYGRSEEYIRKLVCHGVRFANKRAPNLRNAIGHDLSLKAKEEGSPSNILEIDGLSGEEYKQLVADMPEEEKERLITQLEEHRGMKEHGIRATNRGVQMDAVQTGNRVGEVSRVRAYIQQLRNLYERTGVCGFAMFTRGHPDDPAAPYIVDSDNARDFFEDALEIPCFDVVRKMEQWACTRGQNLQKSNKLDAVRSEVSNTVKHGLRSIKKNSMLEMEWANYDLKVRHELGVELAGWPKDVEVQNPSSMSAEGARRIRDLLRTGAIHWVALTKTQRLELANEIEEKRAAGTMKTRKPRCDKDKPRGPRTKKDANKGIEEGGASTPAAARTRTPTMAAAPTAQAPNAPALDAAQVPYAPAPDAAQAPNPALDAAQTHVPNTAGTPAVQFPTAFPPAAATLSANIGPFDFTGVNLSCMLGADLQLNASDGFDFDGTFDPWNFEGIDFGPMPGMADSPLNNSTNAGDLRLNTSNADEHLHLDLGFPPGNFASGPANSTTGIVFDNTGALPSNGDLSSARALSSNSTSNAQAAHANTGLPSGYFGAQNHFAVAPGLTTLPSAASAPSMSVFSVSTNTEPSRKRKHAEVDVEKPPCKARSDKNKPCGPRAKKTAASTADADADERPKPKKRKKHATEAGPEA